MDDRAEHLRASAVVTAVLSGDVALAFDLIEDDEDPKGIARGAVGIAAGLWDHFSQRAGRDPIEAWAQTQLNLQTIKE